MPTILDPSTAPSLPTEPVSTTFSVEAVEAPIDPDEPTGLRRLVQGALDRLPSIGAAAPRLLPAVQGVLLVAALTLSCASSVARAAVGLRRFVMWVAIALGWGVIGTFALCSPPRDPHRFDIGPDPDWQPLPGAVPSDAQRVALGRVS